MERKEMNPHKIQKMGELAQDVAAIGGSGIGAMAIYMEYIDGVLAIFLAMSGIVYTVARTYVLLKDRKKDGGNSE